MPLKNPSYWKNYVIELDADEIERNVKTASFVSGNQNFELICFEKDKKAPCILISPGSAGHSFVFAELGYYMHLNGYSVFIMPKQGGSTINELMQRHRDALKHISSNFNNRIGIFGEGFGGYAVFYLALAQGSFKSMVLQNSPAILTEKKFQDAWMKGKGTAQMRKILLPFAKALLKLFPKLPLPISLYLDFKEMVDTKEENRKIEAPRIKLFLKDPDFDKWYPLSAILSLVLTPPPKPLSELKVPTLFLVPVRGFGGSMFVDYLKDLFNRLPRIKKKLVEVDGSVYWMCSHPKEAAKVICGWFGETV